MTGSNDTSAKVFEYISCINIKLIYFSLSMYWCAYLTIDLLLLYYTTNTVCLKNIVRRHTKTTNWLGFDKDRQNERS